MAAVLASGITTIYNAACEPYIQQLCKMLNRMGAKISGIGSNLLSIEGVEKLGGTDPPAPARYDRSGILYRHGRHDQGRDHHQKCRH